MVKKIVPAVTSLCRRPKVVLACGGPRAVNAVVVSMNAVAFFCNETYCLGKSEVEYDDNSDRIASTICDGF